MLKTKSIASLLLIFCFRFITLLSVTIPHPKCCNKYYFCSYGVPILLACPLFLYYNPITHLCDFQFNVKCLPPKMYCP
ncbi:hypothetical protein RN001_004651 [Aquatica leii]|uniref:Chitin-binding type-2 domain-containing protein n=1 Tax=Aquatica leii TaxID=1421715 RepID=A0AAN7Q051_9COLE|nr:hypothetical protein RN001_004651 [Aquatica leii]